MIKATIMYNNNSINGFKLIGHANSGSYGHDIVCAAVSALSITTVNSLLSIAGVKPQVKKDSINGGLMIVKLPQVHDNVHLIKEQTLLENFKLGIQMIADQYNRYLKLNIVH